MCIHVNVLSLLASFNLFNNPRNKIGKLWHLFTTNKQHTTKENNNNMWVVDSRK